MYGAHLQRGVAVYYGLYLRSSSALVERELLNHDGIESPRQPKQRERVSTLNRIQSERRLRNIELGQISCRHSLTFAVSPSDTSRMPLYIYIGNIDL